MKLYWRIRDLPELQHLSDEQRELVMLHSTSKRERLAMATYAVRTGFWLGLFGGGVYFAKTRDIGMSVLVGCMLGTGTALAAQLRLVHSTRKLVQEVLSESFRHKQLPSCARCGYDLRARQVTTCPECGAPVLGRDLRREMQRKGKVRTLGRLIGGLRGGGKPGT